MAVIRVNKKKNYTCMSNYHLRDTNISLKAIGLLSKILSLPDDWDYSLNGLVAICKEDIRSVRNALNELKENGYVTITKIPPQKGLNRIQYIYDIYEEPIKNEDVQNVYIQNEDIQKEDIQKDIQLNTNKLNTKELNKEQSITEDNIKKVSKKEESFDDIIDNSVENEDVKKELYEFIKMRKLIKRPLTNRALEMIINKLNSLSKDEKEQIKILDQSIINNWQNIYPVKEDERKSTGNIFRDIGIEEGIF